MTSKSSLHHDNCPIEQVMDLLGGKWTMLIIRDLMPGCLRFSQLQQSLGNINPRTLSSRLSALEESGLVIRRAYAEVPPRVEYSLTDKGRALLPLFEAIQHYAEHWL